MKKGFSKKTLVCLVLTATTIVWMAVIFELSADTAKESTSLSKAITEALIRINYQDFDSLTDVQQRMLISKYNIIVRDAAHFGIYALFSFLLYFAVSSIPWFAGKSFRAAGLSFLACVAFAFSDEFHQIFVDGRGAQISDVMLDACGALLGVSVALIITMTFKAVRAGFGKASAE